MKPSKYGTGTITKERSGRYRVRIPDGRGRYRSIGTRDTLEQAERLRAAALDEAQGMTLVGVPLLSYGERVIERWAKAGQRSTNSDRARWSAIVARASFAHAALDVIAPADVRDWARKLPQLAVTRSILQSGKRERITLGRTLSWQSQKHALGLLARVLQEAVTDGLISSNPARGVRLQRRQERDEGWTWLTLPELEALFALELSAEQRAVFTLAVFQGLRLGELAALRWDRVDLEAGWLVIAASWNTATKSGRVRRIPLLQPAAAALAGWAPPDQRKGLVFPAAGGACYSRGYDWGWGDRRCKNGKDVPARAGIARRVRFHDLRHTCAAHLVSGSWGEPWRLREVRDFLGHTSEAVTERYAHLAPDALRARARATAAVAKGEPLPIEPAADLPREIAGAARIVLKLLAGGMRFERMTFGSGVPGDTRDFGDLEAGAAGVRQVSRRLLETVARGELIADLDLARIAGAALAAGFAVPALEVLAELGSPLALRRAVQLATLVIAAAEAEEQTA